MDEFRAGDPCPDCAVVPGERHIPGCDVARCSICGHQDISHDDPEDPEALADPDHDWFICEHSQPSIWHGEWPGWNEARAMGLDEDTNDFGTLFRQRRILWDPLTEMYYSPNNAFSYVDGKLVIARIAHVPNKSNNERNN